MALREFFGSMNSARWIIVVGVLGSIGLAVNGWRLYDQRSALQAQLVQEVPERAQNIQFLGRLFSKLQADAEREGFVTQDKPDLYFRGIATHETVKLGQIDVDPAQPRSYYKDTQDLTYTLRPQVSKADEGFPRDRLANFMFKIEQESGRVRVTRIRLDPAQRLKAWETSDDRWKWEIAATSRAKAPSAGAAK
jgi:hypothetical protein